MQLQISTSFQSNPSLGSCLLEVEIEMQRLEILTFTFYSDLILLSLFPILKYEKYIGFTRNLSNIIAWPRESLDNRFSAIWGAPGQQREKAHLEQIHCPDFWPIFCPFCLYSRKLRQLKCSNRLVNMITFDLEEQTRKIKLIKGDWYCVNGIVTFDLSSASKKGSTRWWRDRSGKLHTPRAKRSDCNSCSATSTGCAKSILNFTQGFP